MKKEFILFDDVTQVYTASGRYEVQPYCNSILFTNTGADIVRVNEKILYPGTVGSILGDTFGLGGNENEIYAKGAFTVIFASVVNPALEVTQKYYKVKE